MWKFCKLNTKNKDRCYEAIITGLKAIVVAVLVTLGGTTITYQSNQFIQKKEILIQARKEAFGIQKKMTNKMNDRYVYSLRVVSAYHWKLDQDKRYTEYDDAIKRWNNELIVDLADIKGYFGESAEKEVYAIIARFKSIHKQIMKTHGLYVNKQPLPDTKPLLEEVYKMDDEISNFADKLKDQLKRGEVDIFVPNPPMKPTSQSPK